MARHDYQPFGEEISRTGYGADTVRKQFTGYERDTETELDFAQARMYANNLGRFSSPDPAKMTKARTVDPQHWNLYVYGRNNPTLMVDLNDEFPWNFHIRSFIYASNVGGGAFRGDGRGPSLETNNPKITSRVKTSFTFDYDAGRITNKNVQSDFTMFYGVGGRPGYPTGLQVKTGTPGASFGNVETLGSSKAVSLHYWGKDPITPGFATPDLDVHANIAISESKTKFGNGTLNIAGTFTGDTFPSTEAFVLDQSGKTKVFLGAKLEEGGVGNLYGDNQQNLFTVDMQIKFDKNGNFTAVIENGKTYTVNEWNKRVESQF